MDLGGYTLRACQAAVLLATWQRPLSCHLIGALQLRPQRFAATHLLVCFLKLPKVFLGSLHLHWEFGLGILEWFDNDYSVVW